jgi:hypothetical protein
MNTHNAAHYVKDNVWAFSNEQASQQRHAQPIAVAKCPYGQIGDTLYVRESFCYVDPDMWRGHIAECPSSEYWPGHYEDWIIGCRKFGIGFKADGDGESQLIAGDVKWKPSIHMPRWASRIHLEITGVRVERLQEISEEDARAEGVNHQRWPESDPYYMTGRDAFIELWDAINAKRGYSWDSNPFVWVVEFQPIAPPPPQAHPPA